MKFLVNRVHPYISIDGGKISDLADMPRLRDPLPPRNNLSFGKDGFPSWAERSVIF